MKKHYRHENDCLNCGAALQGKFCHVCGQENLEIKESFGHMVNDIVSDYFHFDHQFFQTIRPLLFKPGFLTNEYMAGRRGSYLHPVKMYIFISVVYFLVIFQTGHKVVDLDNNQGKTATKTEQNKPGSINIAYKRPGAQTGGVMGKSKVFSVHGDTTIKQYTDDQAKLPPKQRDGWFDRIMSERFIGYNEKYGKLAAEEFSEDIQHNIPKMMFVVLPIVALMLAITFRKNNKFYVEHLIYTLHLHCFIFLFVAILVLLEIPFPDNSNFTQWLGLLAGVYIVWYIYRSLRVVYHRTVTRTITKLIGLLISYALLSVACIIAIVFITALLHH
jgi:hypothetical protein